MAQRFSKAEKRKFYDSGDWRRLRRRVLEFDKYECQLCKEQGQYKKAEIVHHVKHVEDYPELRLSWYYIEDGEEHRNLISVCRDCHESKCHPERLRMNDTKPLNVERW